MTARRQFTLAALAASAILATAVQAMAQTTLVTFAQQNRNGTQTTPWATLPAGGQVYSITLDGVASTATKSNTLNAISFTVFVRQDAQSPEQVIVIEAWRGGTFTNHQGQVVPREIALEVAPLTAYAGWQIRLQAVFSRTMSVGATLAAKPPE